MRHIVIRQSATAFAATVLTIATGLTACSSDSKTSPPTVGATSAGTTAGATGTTAAGTAAGTGAEAVVTGTLVSSGAYQATWTWHTGDAADPGTGGITVQSDKQTYGNIAVLADGSITFSTGAPELSAGQPYNGTGAQVRITNDAPCSFTLDNDVTGSDGTVLHLKGELTLSGGAFC